MKLLLDRMALEDVGAEPQRLAQAILGQIDYKAGKVPIRDIAFALGIAEIREAILSNFEATLLTTPERDCGSILLNAKSSRQRKNFSVGHELGHFLNRYHIDIGESGASCSSKDMAAYPSRADDRHRKQEVEANCFAIELLAPRARCRAFMGSEPAIENILAIAREFDISREAAARRYTELHHDQIAVVFGKERRCVYSSRSATFPKLSVRTGDQLWLPTTVEAGKITEMEDAEISPWIEQGRGSLLLQTLFQETGRTISLLWFTAEGDDDEEEIEDSFDRFSRLAGRD